jgi:P27 family predicted phage terminase small subunit
MSDHNEAPSHLSAESKRLWRKLQSDYAIDDSAGHLLLRHCLEAHDRVIQAREILEREGLVAPDRFGQPKTHPCVAVERDARQQVIASLRALKLEPGAIS